MINNLTNINFIFIQTFFKIYFLVKNLFKMKKELIIYIPKMSNIVSYNY